MSARPLTGVILAGGEASRFGGRAKGLSMVGGRRIIDRVADSLRSATDRLLIVSNDPTASTWLPDVDAVTDVAAQRSSLAGIHAALARAATDVIVVGWDMPFVPAALVTALRASLANHSAVVPWTNDGPEAACAAYASSALPIVEQRLAEGALRLSAFVDVLPSVARVEGAELARFGDPARMFFNVNTPDDLVRAEEMARTL